MMIRLGKISTSDAESIGWGAPRELPGRDEACYGFKMGNQTEGAEEIT